MVIINSLAKLCNVIMQIIYSRD